MLGTGPAELGPHEEDLRVEVGSKSDVELEGKLTLEKNLHLLRDEVTHDIEGVLDEHLLPFKLKDFQKMALHQIGSLNNVILVSPNGSGKMVVIYLSIFVLQKVLSVSDMWKRTRLFIRKQMSVSL